MHPLQFRNVYIFKQRKNYNLFSAWRNELTNKTNKINKCWNSHKNIGLSYTYCCGTLVLRFIT